MTRTFASVGECMVELSLVGERTYRQGFAGDTFNTAWYLRALTAPSDWSVRYVTAFGDDVFSSEMRAFMEAAGIDTGCSPKIAGRPAGLYAIHLTGAERAFSYWRETSAARLLAADAAGLARAFSDVSAVYFSGITLAILSPDHRKTLFDALAAVRARGGVVAFDPNVRLRLWSSTADLSAALVEAYRVATIALPTWPDEQAVFGDPDAAAFLARISALGVPEIVLKAGAAPCLVRSEEGTAEIPAIEVGNPVDTTGAGDSFNAGYLAARLSGASPAEAAAAGHRVASHVIGVRGALAPMAEIAGLARPSGSTRGAEVPGALRA